MAQATRGRPRQSTKDNNLVKQELIQAAAACLTEKSYRAVTIREIAKRANTSSAMISYYYGDKEGLVIALLKSTTTEHLADLTNASYLASVPTEQRTRHLLRSVVSLYQHHPWILRLVADDMLNQDTDLRSILVDTLAGNSFRNLRAFIRLQQDHGFFRQDLDLALTTASLLSQLSFPFLAAPILRDAYGLDMDNIDLQQWIDHTATLFEQGVSDPNYEHQNRTSS